MQKYNFKTPTSSSEFIVYAGSVDDNEINKFCIEAARIFTNHSSQFFNEIVRHFLTLDCVSFVGLADNGEHYFVVKLNISNVFQNNEKSCNTLLDFIDQMNHSNLGTADEIYYNLETFSFAFSWS